MQVADKVIRKLQADEIDCRVAQGSEKGVSLLLYKDARVDQRLLDETFGAMNWQRSHEVIDGNLYCTISIWDDAKKAWVSKQDVGTESNTEAEKGQASDSFKRAGFNWGIGRELYSAPFIWVKAVDCNMESYKDRTGKVKWTTRDKFNVKSITYKDNGEIDGLEIVNEKTSKVVFNNKKTDSDKGKKEDSRMSFDDIRKKLSKLNTVTEVNAFAKDVAKEYPNPTEKMRYAINNLFATRREEISEARNTYHANN